MAIDLASPRGHVTCVPARQYEEVWFSSIPNFVCFPIVILLILFPFMTITLFNVETRLLAQKFYEILNFQFFIRKTDTRGMDKAIIYEGFSPLISAKTLYRF